MNVTMQRPMPHATSSIEHSTVEKFVLPLLTVAVIIATWSAAVQFSGTKIFPSPIAVASAIGTLGEKSLLWRYIADSLARVFARYPLPILARLPLLLLLRS